ncbi:MAG TPA: hypothetical protein VMY34_11725 [Acidimicrobiales bacterium]|nr:hypothetical protein [Acidimicrobiales bacterium]
MRKMVEMPSSPSLRFSEVARLLASEARARGLTAPGFRSPPRIPGADRTIRRAAAGSAVIAVRVRGRPFDMVIADMVEGVLVANRLTAPAAQEARAAMLEVALAVTRQAA